MTAVSDYNLIRTLLNINKVQIDSKFYLENVYMGRRKGLFLGFSRQLFEFFSPFKPSLDLHEHFKTKIR